MKKILCNALLLVSLLSVGEFKSQIVLEALEGKDIKTYTCDAENFSTAIVNVILKSGTTETAQTFRCGRHSYGSYTIQYAFLNKYEDGEYDVYNILQPKVVSTDQEVKVLQAVRHWASYDGLDFRETGNTAIIQ